jgi:pSer/pThr/pTyr-binding forkhead associated (FHA) protein
MNDPSVSRRHARFFTEQGTLWVEDLASANGTMVNGLAVKKNSPTELPDQGEVSFGAVILTTAKY